MLVYALAPQWKQAGLMAVLLAGSIAFQAGGPQVLRRFIDAATQGAAAEVLLRTAALFLGVVIAGQIVSGLAVYNSALVGWAATNRLRSDLALHCLRLDLPFHQQNLPGEMIERIDGDTGLLGNFFSQFTIQVIGNSFLVLAILGLIILEDGRAGGILTAYMALSFLALLGVQRVHGQMFGRLRAHQARVVGWWEEMLTAREDFKPLGVLGFLLRRSTENLRLMLRLDRRATALFRLSVAAFAAVFVIGNAVAFAIGASLYSRGEMTIGAVYLLLYYTNLLATNLGNIANQAGDFQQAAAAVLRVNQLFHTKSAIQDGPGALPFSPAPSVELDHVSFSYHPETPVLHDLSFKLESGQVLGLLGRTGSGKSTIVRLLFRFYDPASGAIRLDGVDLRQARLADLRGAIGMVTQEVQLFHASARDNLTLFDDSLSDNRIRQVICDLGLDSWLQTLPEGLDTLLDGEAGLSAGESQLLALARVFLKDPQLVILDEASSRLDLATEALLERAIARLLAGRTAIVIAHRLTTLRRVDQILLLQEGRMVEHGAPQALAQDPSSHFYHLLQMSDVEVFE